MSPDDKHPMSSSALELMQLVFVFEDLSVSLEEFDLLCPVNKNLLVESLDWEIDWLVEWALVVLSGRAHIENDGNIFVIVHIADLLRSRHSKL